MDDMILEKIVSVTSSLKLDGHRADIVMMKAARALAAFRGLGTISSDEIRDAAWFALRHRLKRLPFEEIGTEREKISEALSLI